MTDYLIIAFVVIYLFQAVIIALQEYRTKLQRQVIEEQNKYIRNITDNFALIHLGFHLEDALECEDYEKADRIKKLIENLDNRLYEQEIQED